MTPRERPILFSAPMVRALLDGRKTMTRRVMKPQPPDWCNRFGYTAFTPSNHVSGRGQYEDQGPAEKFFKIPFGVVGDRIWVKETWWSYKSQYLTMAAYSDGTSRTLLDSGGTHDEPQKEIPHHGRTHWHPESYPEIWRKRASIHMPRWASRITLELTDVRVQRLQEISEEDARAEGITGDDALVGQISNPYRTAFADLWDSINEKKHPWVSNPWVWAITFRRIV